MLNRAKKDLVMLVELSMVEQRYEAVREVLDSGASITDIATRYGVDRRTLHRWLLRYANHSLAALADRSSKPDRCPHQISPEVEARIVELRRAHPGWGPRTILNTDSATCARTGERVLPYSSPLSRDNVTVNNGIVRFIARSQPFAKLLIS